MRYLSAQYIYTNAGPPLKRGIITVEDDGTIVSVEDSGGNLAERHSVEFHNGIIVPGFVNCHCHLELSFMKNEIPAGTGLADFLRAVNTIRYTLEKDVSQAIKKADTEMSDEGLVLCADICNNDSTFDLKKNSRIKYISLLEVFGIDPARAEFRMSEMLKLADTAERMDLPHWIVPHAFYSISIPLFRLIKEHTRTNKVTSIHFMESPDEVTFFENHSGRLMDYYRQFIPSFSEDQLVYDPVTAFSDLITSSGTLILVHNTFATRKIINTLNRRPDTWWCLCPGSNLHIENKMPPANLFATEGCNIVIGTDSLSSNSSLSIIDEIKTIQENYSSFSLETLIAWATLNGARALGEESQFGSIEPGKKPGLVILKNVDLVNQKLLPATTSRRLI
jgi:cytosine/adenosine deaminase-related metal-dependent hydrolase